MLAYWPGIWSRVKIHCSKHVRYSQRSMPIQYRTGFHCATCITGIIERVIRVQVMGMMDNSNWQLQIDSR
jgi:hypothetical protein